MLTHVAPDPTHALRDAHITVPLKIQTTMADHVSVGHLCTLAEPVSPPAAPRPLQGPPRAPRRKLPSSHYPHRLSQSAHRADLRHVQGNRCFKQERSSRGEGHPHSGWAAAKSDVLQLLKRSNPIQSLDELLARLTSATAQGVAREAVKEAALAWVHKLPTAAQDHLYPCAPGKLTQHMLMSQATSPNCPELSIVEAGCKQTLQTADLRPY